ncbi:MAG: ExbD/TolR family protein [Phycisphaeraceae bacterium]
MRRIRRSSESARVEMTPLIDVVFLLLTFFILSMLVTVRAEVLPVQLSPVGTGESVEPGRILAITIDARGEFYVDREPVPEQELDRRLEALADMPDEQRPRIFVAMEESLRQAEPSNVSGSDDARAEPAPAELPPEPDADRGPILLRLIERLRRAGLTDVSFIGDRE